MLWGLTPSTLSHTIGFLPLVASKHYFRRRRMFDCFVIHTFTINDYRQTDYHTEWCPRKLTKKFVELHMKCIKVTVFKYFQTVAIYSTKCFLFSPKCTKFVSVWGSAPRPRWGSLQRSPRPPSWIWLGSRRVPTENIWSNPLFKTLATAL